MKYALLLIFGVFLYSSSWAQSYRGTLLYEQAIGGVTTPVSITVEDDKVVIERKEAVALQYISSNAGTLDVRVDGGPAVEVPLPELDAATQMKFGAVAKTVGGYACKSVSQTLNGGMTLEGWATESISAPWNRLIRSVQGQEWGQTIGFGAMVEWEVKGAKGDVILRCRLVKSDPWGTR
jgi:hypothetical protein